MTRDSRKRLGLLAVAIGVYALAVRPRMLRYCATHEEVERGFPEEHVILGGRRGATMATTIGATPSEVWPWPARIGCDRAGWYSRDRLDNGGRPSVEAIHPEWQHIATGDRLASPPDGSARFEVAALEPERFLGPRATLYMRGRPVVPGGPKPRIYTDSL